MIPISGEDSPLSQKLTDLAHHMHRSVRQIQQLSKQNQCGLTYLIYEMELELHGLVKRNPRTLESHVRRIKHHTLDQ